MGQQSIPSVLDYVTAFGSIATPILVLILSGIGWLIVNKFNKARELEEKLRNDRIEIYNSILEPFILLFVKDEGLKRSKKYQGKNPTDLAKEIVLSLEYRQAAFKLSLIGSDEVFKAFNDLMQHTYSSGLNHDSQSKEYTKKLIKLFGTFLLEIRKSVGNESTKLNYHEMLEYLIRDVKNYID